MCPRVRILVSACMHVCVCASVCMYARMYTKVRRTMLETNATWIDLKSTARRKRVPNRFLCGTTNRSFTNMPSVVEHPFLMHRTFLPSHSDSRKRCEKKDISEGWTTGFSQKVRHCRRCVYPVCADRQEATDEREKESYTAKEEITAK